MDLAHRIVAMTGDRIARVECKTCRKIHAFRAAKGVTSPLSKDEAAPKGSKAERPVAVELEWERTRAAKKSEPSKPYHFKSTFEIGNKISHPDYGEGFVTKLLFPNKVQVLFRDDLKILIHAKT